MTLRLTYLSSPIVNALTSSTIPFACCTKSSSAISMEEALPSCERSALSHSHAPPAGSHLYGPAAGSHVYCKAPPGHHTIPTATARGHFNVH